MQKSGQNKKRSLSTSKTPTQGGAGGAGGEKRKVKLTPASEKYTRYTVVF